MMFYLVSWIHVQVAFLQRQEGQDQMEYAMLLGFIAFIAIASVVILGDQIGTAFINLASTLQSVL